MVDHGPAFRDRNDWLAIVAVVQGGVSVDDGSLARARGICEARASI